MNQRAYVAAVLICFAGCRSDPAISNIDAGQDAGARDAGAIDAGSDAGERDAGFDAGEVDAGPADAGIDGGSDAGVDGGPHTPITTASQLLSGDFEFPVSWNSTNTVMKTLQLQLYFPEGRHAGAPFVLATTDRVIGTQSGVLNESAGSDDINLTGSGYCFWYTGALVGPDDGLHVTAHWNPSCGGDAIEDLPANGWLRFLSQPAPPGALESFDEGFVPNSDISFFTPVPIDVATASGLVVKTGSVELTGTFNVYANRIAFTPTEAFPPNESVHIEATSLKDVIGRDIGHDFVVQPWVATTPVTDLSLMTAPPDESVWPGGWTAANPGQLRMERYQGSGLVMLERPEGTTRLQIRLTHDCESFEPWVVAAVTRSGHSVRLTIGCEDGPAEQIITLPEEGPVWISLLTYGGWGPIDFMVIDRLEMLP